MCSKCFKIICVHLCQPVILGVTVVVIFGITKKLLTMKASTHNSTLNDQSDLIINRRLYRKTICILPHASKILKQIIKHRNKNKMDQYESEDQFGFRSGR